MQVNVQVLSGLNRKVTVTVPAEGIEQEVEKRIRELTPRARIAGFREGKVPATIVRQHYGDSIRNEVISEVLQRTYREALEQQKLVPAGLPSMRFINSTAGQPLEYEATFEIYPSIEFKGLDTITLEAEKVTITDQDVDEMLERLKKQLIEWVPVDRPAQSGDQVLIDFEGHINGETFEGSAGKEVLLELGSGSAIPGFETGLIGANNGDNVQLALQFPENYARQELAGKSVQITVSVHKISEAKLPELNQAFAQKFGVNEGGVDVLRVQVRKNMEQDVERAIKNQLRSQLIDRLLAANPLEIPNSLVETEALKLKQQAEQQIAQMRRQGQAVQAEPPVERFTNLARQRVSLGLLFGEYIRQQQLKVDPERVQAMLEQIAAPYKDAADVLAWYRSNKEQMAGIESIVLEEQVVEVLLKQVKLSEKNVSYQEFMSRSAAATPQTVEA